MIRDVRRIWIELRVDDVGAGGEAGDARLASRRDRALDRRARMETPTGRAEAALEMLPTAPLAQKLAQTRSKPADNTGVNLWKRCPD
jgi:hypothetical protein